MFWKVFSYFKLIISEYLDQIPPWKEIKDAFSVKLQTESLFFLKIKLNKIQATQIRNIIQSSSTFIKISGPVPELKKPALTNDWKNIAYWKEIQQRKALAN